MRVVLVEDSSSMRVVVRAMLKAIGATEVLQAKHGAEAWDLVRSRDVDLIITDWLMPVMDGRELLRRVRDSTELAKLPVILITARAERDDMVQALRAGADAILVKPFSKSQLKAKVDHVLDRLPARRIERILLGGDRMTRGETHPLVVIGQSAVTAASLARPGSAEDLGFLAAATECLRTINARSPDTHIGYLLEASCSDIGGRLRACSDRVKMLVLDANLVGAITLARLVSINKRDDMYVFLVCRTTGEIEERVRFGLDRLGVQILERHRIDMEAMESLYAEYVLAPLHDTQAEVGAQMLTPEEISKRMESDLRSMVELPVLPQVYQRIVELDRDADSDLDEWIEAIEADPLTRAQVIRRARSPLYGFRGEINEARKAVILLGKKPVKEIVVSGAVKRSFESVTESGFNIETYWLHSVAVAVVADTIALPLDESEWTAEQRKQVEDSGLEEEALAVLRDARLWAAFALTPHEDPFVAGMMHDIGRVAMAVGYPGFFTLAIQETVEGEWSAPLRLAEQTLAAGADHTIAGAILADSWKLGEDTVQVIRHHHDGAGPGGADLIAVADFIAGGIYPFPADAAFPMQGLFAPDGPKIDAALRGRLEPFLGSAVLERLGLDLDGLVTAARVLEPAVRRVVESIRSST